MPPEDNATGSWVYFVQQGEDGPFKVGVSRRPWRRFASFQTANAEQLRMRALVPGGYDLEQTIHARLADYRLCGEWFSPTGKALRYLEAAATKHPPGEGTQREQVAEVRARLVDIEARRKDRQGLNRWKRSKERTATQKWAIRMKQWRKW